MKDNINRECQNAQFDLCRLFPRVLVVVVQNKRRHRNIDQQKRIVLDREPDFFIAFYVYLYLESKTFLKHDLFNCIWVNSYSKY